MPRKGQTAWNKGKKFPHSPEWTAKRLAASREAIKRNPPRRGYQRPKEHTQPMRDALCKARAANPNKYRQLSISNLPKDCNGAKNGNWKGGVTVTTRGMRFSKEARVWRKTVFERDGHKCRLCGNTQSLHAHHIIPISECALIAWVPMNGIVLCKSCHYEQDEAWRGRRYKQIQFSGKPLALIFAIPHKLQAYPTVGNWQFTKEQVPVIFVSEMGDEKYELLIAVHELVEVVKCKAEGVSQAAVDAFDIEFEKNRKEGDETEPGDDPKAPYYHQHQAAMAVERLCAVLWGVDWETYAKRVEEMP